MENHSVDNSVDNPAMPATNEACHTAQDLLSRVDALQPHLAGELEQVLQTFPLAGYVQHMDNHSEIGKYQLRSADFVQAYQAVADQYPQQAAGYQALAMTEIVRASAARLAKLQITDDIRALTLDNLSRILNNIAGKDYDYMVLGDDQFDKDLACASLRLVCAGAQKIHRVRLPNYTIKRHPLKWLSAVREVGLNGVLYEIHTDSNDPYLMSEFNEDGWIACYRRIAEQFKLDEVQGITGTSWFFDPKLAAISPRLAYLRNIIVDNGGISINAGSNESSIESATRTSPTRRELYNKGEYLPTAYTLIWPRAAMLEWAANA